MKALIGWVVLLSLLLAVAGGMYWQNWQGAAIGIVVGVIAGTWVWINNIAAILHPDSFITITSETKSVDNTNSRIDNHIIVSINIPELGTRQLRGLTYDEWNKLGNGVVEHGYRYTVRDLQGIFGPSEGNRIYGRITQQLVDAAVLTPSGPNGYAVTEHVGKNFFDMLVQQDYKVIDLLPRQAPESA